MAKKLSKKLLYKIGIPLAVAGTVVAPVAAVVSCDDATGSSSNVSTKWAFGSHRIVQSVVSSASGISYLEETGISNFNTPLSNLGDTDSITAATASMALSLFRVVTPKFDQYTFTNGKVTGITPNRDIALRFELVKSMTVNFFDGSHETFDSDNDDISNVKSINSDHFKATLQKGEVKNYTFNLRNDISNHHWIQQITGKKGSTISSKDLWRSLFLREFNYGLNRSESFGLALGDQDSDKTKPLTIKKMDDHINSQMRRGYSVAVSTGTAQSGRGIFHSLTTGFDNQTILDSLTDDTKKQEIIPNDYTFVIPFDAKNKKDGLETQSIWDNYFRKGTIFCATPNTEIEQAAKVDSAKSRELHDLLVGTVTDADPKKAYTFTEADWNNLIKTDLFKSGFLQWKISPREQQFVAGKYYFSESTTKLWVAKRNEDFIDERWLNQKNKNGQFTTILEYREKTIQESQVSKMQIANEYIAGTSANSAFINLSPVQQAAALQDIKGWGIAFSKGYTGAKMIGDYTYAPLLPFLKGNGNAYFNNNFAKAMYGDTPANYIDANYSTPEKLIEYQVSGLGAQFRTNLYALLNKTSFWRTAKSTAIGWDSIFAPEGNIGVDDKGNSVILSNVIANPAETAKNGVDEEKVVANNVITFENGTPKIYAIPSNTYLDQVADPTINKYGPSPKPLDSLPLKPNSTVHYSPFEFIQANIKEVLDKTVGPIVDPNNIPDSQKVTFEWTYGRGMTTERYNVSYKEWQQFLKTVDPRLNMVAAVAPSKESDKNSDATPLVIGDGSDGKVKWENFTTAPDTPVGALYSFRERLYSLGNGYSFASINSSVTYNVNSPATVLTSNLGYQQTGALLSLSYLADNETTLLAPGSAFAPLKTITDFLKKRLEEQKTRFSDPNYKLNYQSSHAQEIVDALNSPEYKLENLYKSNIKNIAAYDYAGWKGFDTIIALKDSIKGKATLTDDEKKLSSDLNRFDNEVSKFFDNADLIFDREFIAQNQNSAAGTQKILDLMQTFEALFYQNFNPYSIQLGDRRIINVGFQKTWYSTHSPDILGGTDLSRDRVDLDTVEPGNYLSDKVIVGEVY